MNLESPSGKLILATCQLTLFIMATIALLFWQDSRASYTDSYQNLIRSQQFSERIAELRSMDTVANEKSSDAEFSNSVIVRLAMQANVTERQVRSIRRPSPVTQAGGDYQRLDILVDLEQVNMEQIARFALRCEQLRSSMKVNRIELSANASKSTMSAEQWNAQLTLTQLLYVARSSHR